MDGKGLGALPSDLPIRLSRRNILSSLGAASALTLLRANAAPVAGSFGGVAVSGQAVQGGWLRGVAPAGAVGLRLNGAAVPLMAGGAFFIAFDRDAAATHEVEWTFASGQKRAHPFTVAPRAWKIEHVNAPLRPGKLPDAEYQRIRAAELQRIAAARTIATSAQGWRQDFARPAAGRISGRFGSQRVYQGKPGAYHSGLDIAAPTGTPFTAPADGVVILAAQVPFTLEGHLLMLDHGAGLNSAFLHCSTLLVKEGDAVTQGQTIGRIGATGRSTGPHLHWSLKWQDARLDPLLFLREQK